jgi:membrane-bound ClpP family serine protease
MEPEEKNVPPVMEKFSHWVHNSGGSCRPQEGLVKKHRKAISKPRAIREPSGSTRVIRISEEAWAAKCAETVARGKPVEIAAYFDRAQWLSQTKVS